MKTTVTMYSGSDSTESQNYAQWALNPSTYQNMSNDQVDWAALAQQWIIMKEAGPPPMIPSEHRSSTPISKSRPKKEILNEGGEAPMDVENDKDDSNPEWSAGPQGNNSDWSWNAQNQSWGWNNAWTTPTGVPPPIPMKPPLLPTPSSYNQFSGPPESTNDNASFAGPGYWTASGSKHVKPHNRRFSKVNVPRPIQPSLAESQPALDAAKRKQLPAWIREGLEKMERDKLKQIEREKEKQDRDEYKLKMKLNEKETMEILKTTIKEQQKSKFESDGEYSDEDAKEKKKRVVHAEPVPLTSAEQMMNVRHTMTEILLKVTNREIEMICREELQRHLKKYKASDQRSSAPSGANVTAKLGLGIYGGSGSSSSDNSDDETSQDRRDSDADLKDSIKRKRVEFSKTEREIEDKLTEAENRKQEVISRSPSPDANDNDTQVDAKLQGRKQRPSANRTPSTTPLKRQKSRSSSSSSGGASPEPPKRRSSTSSGNNTPKKTIAKRRSRSRSRSHTPDQSRHIISTSSARRKSNSSRRSRTSRSRSNSRSRKTNSSSSRYSRSKRTRSRSASYMRRSSRSRSRNKRSRSRNKKSKSPAYSKSRRSRSRSSRRRRSRSSSSGRGKRSRRR